MVRCGREAGEFGDSLLGHPSSPENSVQTVLEARRGSPWSAGAANIARSHVPLPGQLLTKQFPDLGCTGENIDFEELLEIRSLTKTLELSFKA